MQNYNEAYFVAKERFETAKKENTVALERVKELAKTTPEYEAYIKINANKNQAFEVFTNVIKENSFLGFKSFKYFLEKFAFILVIFLYALYNLIRSFYIDYTNVGVKVVHTAIISVCMFNFFWIFQQFSNFNKVTYLLVTLLSAVLVCLAAYLITRNKKLYVDEIRDDLVKLAEKALVNAQPEKRGEMREFIEQLSKK